MFSDPIPIFSLDDSVWLRIGAFLKKPGNLSNALNPYSLPKVHLIVPQTLKFPGLLPHPRLLIKLVLNNGSQWLEVMTKCPILEALNSLKILSSCDTFDDEQTAITLMCVQCPKLTEFSFLPVQGCESVASVLEICSQLTTLRAPHSTNFQKSKSLNFQKVIVLDLVGCMACALTIQGGKLQELSCSVVSKSPPIIRALSKVKLRFKLLWRPSLTLFENKWVNLVRLSVQGMCFGDSAKELASLVCDEFMFPALKHLSVSFASSNESRNDPGQGFLRGLRIHHGIKVLAIHGNILCRPYDTSLVKDAFPNIQVFLLHGEAIISHQSPGSYPEEHSISELNSSEDEYYGPS